MTQQPRGREGNIFAPYANFEEYQKAWETLHDETKAKLLAVEKENGKLSWKIEKLEAELEAMTTLFNKESDRLNWLDMNTSFVADEKYRIGPYKVGELRAMADDGIAADKKHKPTTLRENLGQG